MLCLASKRKVASFWEDRGSAIECPDCKAMIPFSATEEGDWDWLIIPIHSVGQEYTPDDDL